MSTGSDGAKPPSITSENKVHNVSPRPPSPSREKDISNNDAVETKYLPAEPPSEQPQHIVASEDYSVFTVPQKRAIVIAGSFMAWFSPMTGSIYYPALNQIAADLHVSDSKVNITVTTYLIVQGLAPMMVAGFSDKAGRRPAYVACFIIYIIANLALGLQNNYIALLILRMLQSGGSSGTVALANGMVGDIVTSADRGKYIAYASVGSLLGPSLSPILGGLLSQYLGWHWVFWFLLILSGACFVPMLLFLPETCRNIVGDHSVPPPWSSVNITDNIRFRNRAAKGLVVNEEKMEKLRKNYKLSIPNPIATLKVLTDFEAALLLVATGLVMACVYAIFTGVSSVFKQIYGFNELQISLMFLPIGAGSLLSAFTTGRMVDWNYRRHARRLNFPVHKNRQTDLSNFPIELVRMQIGLPLLLLAAVMIIMYGWIMDHHYSLAAPIIILFVLGYCLIAGFQVLNVLMVDIYPGQPATATAANNFCRCLLGAAASAAITPMTKALGNGWAYTILALLFVVASAGPAASMRYGIAWRRIRKQRMEARAAKREERKRRKEGVGEKNVVDGDGAVVDEEERNSGVLEEQQKEEEDRREGQENDDLEEAEEEAESGPAEMLGTIGVASDGSESEQEKDKGKDKL